MTSPALTPDLIAGNFGLSRAVLYRIFEPAGGVASFIRSRRMARALHDLIGQRSSTSHVAEVARRYGYESPSAFSRAFRETYGIAPRRLFDAAPPASASTGRLTSWLAPLSSHARRASRDGL